MRISGLSNSLTSMTNSYKYLFLRSLADLIQDSNFKKDTFSFEEIALEMLSNSWRLILFWKFSFGNQDQIDFFIQKAVDAHPEITKINEIKDKKKIKKILSSLNFNEYKDIMRYVPQRILRGFFSAELRGKKDGVKDKLTIELSQSDPNCLYLIDSGLDDPNTHIPASILERSIIINQVWMDYFKENMPIIIGWMERHWIDYLASRNPSIPNISNKIKPDISRDLTKQRNAWKDFMKVHEVHCIYTGIRLSKNNFALDHFIPFSYTAHNEYWNLIPVLSNFAQHDLKNANSSKSNILPHSKYIEEFVSLQIKFLKFTSDGLIKNNFDKVISEYKNFLVIKDNLDDWALIKEKYTEKVAKQINTAASHGFIGDWIYS